MVEVRAVTRVDAAAWASLRHSLWPDEPLEALTAQAREFFDSGTPLVAAAFLAWDGDHAIGFLELSVRAYVPGADSLPAPFVEGWFVDAARRRAGVGGALVRAAEEWARDQGYSQLGSDALVDNTISAEAHEALGFRTVEVIRSFIKDLRGSLDS